MSDHTGAAQTPFFPDRFAAERPDRAAVIMAASGEILTYRELDEISNRIANLFRMRSIMRGDHVALLMPNSALFFGVAWACQRSGLYFTPINTRFTAKESAYIIRDCGAKALIVSADFRQKGEELARETFPALILRLSVHGEIRNFEPLESMIEELPEVPVDDQSEGSAMIYSSGTTGRPKGIKRPLPESGSGRSDLFLQKLSQLYDWGEETVYLCPAPTYHGAGLWYTMAMHRIGAMAVVMEKFTPEGFLGAVEKYAVTDTQVVPTMFVRLLKLPKGQRAAYDLSSLKTVIHAAAPCPVDVKERMIEWLGPIIYEYYAATEANGYTFITPGEWLAHKGSVGRPMIGDVHIVGPDGDECAPGRTGMIYFGGHTPFSYHNDRDKTEEARHPKGWTTVGDIGYVDEDGYLYLTDRKAFTIISGGVNIYPQEIEDLLIAHPDVLDAAVFGVPDAEYGEQVKAVVQLVDGTRAGGEMEAGLIAYCRESLATHKCPRSVDFLDELPRDENGKLYKLELRRRYWSDNGELPR